MGSPTNSNRYLTVIFQPSDRNRERLLLLAISLVMLCGLAAARSVGVIRARSPQTTSAVGPSGVSLARLSDEISVHAAGRGNPWINLSDGREVITPYSGPAELTRVLEENEAQALSLCSADFDEDGVPDLISGYGGPNGGIVTLLRGNVDSIYPNAPEAKKRKAEGAFTDAPFLAPAFAFGVPEAADFIGAGDFDRDGHYDVVSAHRNSRSLHLISGDGRGGLSLSRLVVLSGNVTAMVVGEMNRRDGFDDIVVAVSGEAGAKALVFDGPGGALTTDSEEIDLPGEATSLALGQLDDEPNYDLAIAAGQNLMIIRGRNRRHLPAASESDPPPATEVRAFANTIESIAIGNFSCDPTEGIALFFRNGEIKVLADKTESRETKITRLDLMQAKTSVKAIGPQETTISSHALERSSAKEGSPSEEHLQKSVRPIGIWSETSLARAEGMTGGQLIRARISNAPVDTLLVTDDSAGEMRIVVPQVDKQKLKGPPSSDLSEKTPDAVLDVASGAVAVLPMRLNKDAQSDLVLLKAGSAMPSVVQTLPHSILVVTNTNNAGAGSLRDLIAQANSTAGADEIRFSIPGAGVRTISLTSALPPITGALTIDGYTQPGASQNILATGDNAVLLIELNGTNAGPTSGLNVSAGNCVVRGLTINRFPFAGIDIDTNGFNRVEGNFIGVNAAGTIALGNGADGIGVFSSPDNTIGGTTPAARNVLSGNRGNGVYVLGNQSAREKVQGNHIGTTAAGFTKLGNSGNGVWLENTTSNTIGGPTASASNTIGGNSGPPSSFIGNGIILLNAQQFLIQNNFIGTDPSSTLNLGNSRNGIVIDQTSNDGTVRDVVVAHNGRLGIAQNVSSSSIIRPNVRIFSNVSGGLDLFEGSNLFTISDFRITSVSISGSNLIVSGFLFANEQPHESAIVDFYSGAASGSGSQFIGMLPTYLGARTVVTDSNGIANFTFDFPLPQASAGHFVNAQATDDRITFFNSNLLQIGAPCSYNVVPSSSNLIPGSGGTGSFLIQTQGNCQWALLGNSFFVENLSDFRGAGTKVVSYTVPPNPLSSMRTTVLIVEGKTHTVTQAGGSACVTTPINLGQTVNGNISDGDCFAPDGASSDKADIFTLNASAGQIITITMNNASSIDPRLSLIGPDGAFLAFDNNSGGGSNARIDYPIVRSGSYSIQASVTQSSHRGAYSLSVTSNGGCTVTPINIGQTLSGTLSDSDCSAPHRSGSKADFYRFNGTAAQTVTITMNKNSLADPFLLLLGPGASFGDFLTSNNDIISGVVQDSQLTFSLKASGTHTIEATAFEPGQRGSYSLSVTIFSRNSQLVSQNAASQVAAGSRFHHFITMRNTGSTAWTSFGGFRVGAQSPADNTIWGRERFNIQSPVAAGGQDTFDLLLIAPEVAGTYDLQWRLLQTPFQQPSIYFGDTTSKLRVTVVPTATDTDNDGIPNSLESQDGKNPNVKDNDVDGNNLLFVKQIYRDFLGREGPRGPNDVDFWLGELNRGVTRAEVVADFFNVPEFERNTTVVVKMFDICFMRLPDYESIRFWIDESTSGRRSNEGVANGFLTSNEFLAAHPNLSDARFIDLMYDNALNRGPTFNERTQRLNELASGRSRGYILADIAANSAEINELRTRTVQIVEMYLAMLRRVPTASEFNTWVSRWSTAVSEGRRKQKRIEMANAILNGEDGTVNLPYIFHRRFLPIGPIINRACKGEGKQLIINGTGFVAGAKVFLNGVQEKTSFVSSTQVIAKKAGKRAVTGHTLKVRNPDGAETAVFNYVRVNCSP